MKFIFFFSVLIFTVNSCNFRHINSYSNEGIIRDHSINIHYDKTSNVYDYNFQVWYCDSAVIFQHVFVSMKLGVDSIPATLKTYKYVYLDLRNLKCQDYRTLDASAKPFGNYKLQRNESILSHFFEQDYTLPIFKTKTEKLDDTIIAKKNYKRILYKGTKEEPLWQRTIYLTAEDNNIQYHIYPMLDKQYYPLRVIRLDDLLDGKLTEINYIEPIKTELSNYERSVFKNWKINADTTTLPMLTLEEIDKNNATEKFKNYKDSMDRLKNL